LAFSGRGAGRAKGEEGLRVVCSWRWSGGSGGRGRNGGGRRIELSCVACAPKTAFNKEGAKWWYMYRQLASKARATSARP